MSNRNEEEIASIKDVIAEADRFIKSAKTLMVRLKNSRSDWVYTCKERASMKRASMDLSRQLTIGRKPL